MSFSERLGYKKPKLALQFDEVDDPLKNGLWNILLMEYFSDTSDFNRFSGTSSYSNYFRLISIKIWGHYFKLPVDALPLDPEDTVREIRAFFLKSEFPYTYNFLEFIASYSRVLRKPNFMGHCNHILEREKSAFRFVGQQLVQITNKTEIAEIEKAQSQQDSKSVSTHIDRAVTCYSNREKPDYLNSIKESILAVEAAAIKITEKPKATLGAALKELRKNNALPTVLNEGFTKLYGWTSGPNGIRHALEDETNVGEAEARYMLVSCSAFAN